MAVHTEWVDDSEQVIRWTMQGEWCLTQLFETYGKTREMIEDSTQHVHAIIDLRDGMMVPDGDIPIARHPLQRAPQNIGKAVIISNRPLPRALANAIINLQNGDHRLMLVDNHDAAQQMIAQFQAEFHGKS